MIASRAVKEGELPMRIFVVVVAVCGALGCAKPADRPEEAPESTFRLRAGAWEKCVITHLVDYDPDFHVWCRAPKTPAIENWLSHTDTLGEALGESRGEPVRLRGRALQQLHRGPRASHLLASGAGVLVQGAPVPGGVRPVRHRGSPRMEQHRARNRALLELARWPRTIDWAGPWWPMRFVKIAHAASEETQDGCERCK